jgi:hypothetical protein
MIWFKTTGPPNPISRAAAVSGERSTMRVPDEVIRFVMVTSTSLPFWVLVILALPPIGIALWAAVKPSSSISFVAIPRWTIGCLCAIQKLVVNNNPSIASITRLILYLLPSPGQISGAKYTLPLIIIHPKENTRFFKLLIEKKYKTLKSQGMDSNQAAKCSL